MNRGVRRLKNRVHFSKIYLTPRGGGGEVAARIVKNAGGCLFHGIADLFSRSALWGPDRRKGEPYPHGGQN